MANCYQLINCKNTLDTFYVPEPIQFYLGRVIKIEGSTNCYSIDPNPIECFGEENPVTVTASYTTCLDCLGIVIEEIPKVVPEFFEEYTQIQEIQNEIDTNVKFANAYWDLFKSLKHGMESNCDNIDIDKITVKKKSCDIAKLYDESACIIPTTPPVAEVCVEPTGIPLPAPIT